MSFTRDRVLACAGLALLVTGALGVALAENGDYCMGSGTIYHNPDGSTGYGAFCGGTCIAGSCIIIYVPASDRSKCACPGSESECCHLEWKLFFDDTPAIFEAHGLCDGEAQGCREPPPCQRTGNGSPKNKFGAECSPL